MLNGPPTPPATTHHNYVLRAAACDRQAQEAEKLCSVTQELEHEPEVMGTVADACRRNAERWRAMCNEMQHHAAREVFTNMQERTASRGVPLASAQATAEACSIWMERETEKNNGKGLSQLQPAAAIAPPPLRFQ